MPPSPSSPILFPHLLPITPLSPNTYTTHLHDHFCTGTVPNGGYITSSFLLAAKTHILTTHPTSKTIDPITLHLEFVRPTNVGPARFTVVDVKIGARVSVLRITLSQKQNSRKGGGSGSGGEGKWVNEVEGYVNLTSLAHEDGPTRDTGYQLLPEPLPVDLGKVVRGDDVNYIRRRRDPYGGFRRATLNVEMYLVRPEARGRADGGAVKGILDQWIRFTPLKAAVDAVTATATAAAAAGGGGGEENGVEERLVDGLKKGDVPTLPGRWTNDALGFLVDIFPQLNERWVNPEIEDAVLQPSTVIPDAAIRDMVDDLKRKQQAAKEGNGKGKNAAGFAGVFWYPTLLLNLDVKKKLPEEGVEWLFVRMQAKAIRRGRFDLNVEVWDEGGELVALSTHASLVVDAARNTTRKGTGDGKGKKETKGNVKESKI